jgi:hypothetical protein
MKNFKTPKGTDLPLLDLRGKDYLEVKWRLVWFREEHPDWSIETMFVATAPDSALAKATVKDEDGRIVATSHKFENKQGFGDFLEKAETGAIGRALALIGFGTQFCADELDEGERVVDSPVTSKPQAATPQQAPGSPESPPQDAELSIEYFKNFRITFGKYRGKTLGEIKREDIKNYMDWIEREAEKKNQALSVEAAMLNRMSELYFAALDQQEMDEQFGRITA